MTDILVNMTSGSLASLAQNLRSARRERGLSVVELARRAQTSRATLTQLESGGGNPTLDTLYALANALDAPLADLIAPPPAPDPTRVVPAGTGPRVKGDAVEAWLLATEMRAGAVTEMYDFRLHSSVAQRSAGHPAGTREHLYVSVGRIRVGPLEDLVEIGAGTAASFDAGREHLYQRIGRAQVRGVLVITSAG